LSIRLLGISTIMLPPPMPQQRHEMVREDQAFGTTHHVCSLPTFLAKDTDITSPAASALTALEMSE
jgi:hypothetical protein